MTLFIGAGFLLQVKLVDRPQPFWCFGIVNGGGSFGIT